MDEPVTAREVFLGTPGYGAPEQATGSGADERPDVFAFGVLCYERLSGTPAYRKGGAAKSVVAVFGPPPASGVRPEIPAAVDTVLARCLALDAAARYGDMTEALADLLRALARECPTVAIPAATPAVASPLPLPPTRLIGRERDVEDVCRLLTGPDVRLVTVTGSGRVGRCRRSVPERDLTSSKDNGCAQPCVSPAGRYCAGCAPARRRIMNRARGGQRRPS